jgi:hypothetical protein
MKQERHFWKRGFLLWSVQRGCKEDSWGKQGSSVKEPVNKRGSWNEAAVQRGLDPGSRGIAIVEAVIRQVLVKTSRAGKGVA